MITTERKLLLSLVDLSLYDIPKALQLVERSVFDYDNDFSSQSVKLGIKCAVQLIKSGLPATPDLLANTAIKFGSNNSEAEQLKTSIVNYESLGMGAEGFVKDVVEQGDKRRLLKTLESIQNSLIIPKTRIQDCLKRLSVDAFRSRDARSHKKLTDYTLKIADALGMGVPPTKVISTGVKELDRVIAGWQPTLNLVGAEPGVGKSALFSTSIDYCGRRGIKVGFFSLEDEPSFMSYRVLSSDSGVNQFKLRYSKLSDSDFNLVADSFARTKRFQDNIFVIDGSDRAMTADEISATSNDLVYNHGVEIIFVDHLGEIVSRSADRPDLVVSEQLSTLRRINNRLGIPVVVAAHFRRPHGGGRILKPVLTDFANSAGAERKARVALGLTRDPGTDIMNIHILKQTNGPSGLVVDAKFDGAAAMLLATEGGQH